MRWFAVYRGIDRKIDRVFDDGVSNELLFVVGYLNFLEISSSRIRMYLRGIYKTGTDDIFRKTSYLDVKTMTRPTT